MDIMVPEINGSGLFDDRHFQKYPLTCTGETGLTTLRIVPPRTGSPIIAAISGWQATVQQPRPAPQTSDTKRLVFSKVAR
jgi:hypothetical protein